MKFYRCDHCKNIITYVDNKGVPVHCCGQPMTELIPLDSSNPSAEKHVPVVEIDNNKINVSVGSIPHPSVEEHYIQFIAIETKFGSQIRYFKPGELPNVQFILAEGDEFIAAYELCNIHGFWKS